MPVLRFCREHELFGQIDDAAAVARKIDELLEVLRNTSSKSKIGIDAAFAAALVVESSGLDEAYEKLTRPLARAHLLLYEAIQSSLRLHHLMTVWHFASKLTAILLTLFQTSVLDDVDDRQICHPDQQNVVPKLVTTVVAGQRNEFSFELARQWHQVFLHLHRHV